MIKALACSVFFSSMILGAGCAAPDKDTSLDKKEPLPTVEALPTTLEGVRSSATLRYAPLFDTVFADILPPQEAEGPFSGFPVRVRYTFDSEGRADADEWCRTPQIRIYKMSDWASIWQQFAPDEIFPAKLIEEFHKANVPTTALDPLPLLPPPTAFPFLKVHLKTLRWNGIYGVRYVSMLAHDISPIVNEALFYTFQGITDDKQYYISATMPISFGKILPETFGEISEKDLENILSEYEQYVQRAVAYMDGLPPAATLPSLTTLDSLMYSLSLSPTKKLP